MTEVQLLKIIKDLLVIIVRISAADKGISAEDIDEKLEDLGIEPREED